MHQTKGLPVFVDQRFIEPHGRPRSVWIRARVEIGDPAQISTVPVNRLSFGAKSESRGSEKVATGETHAKR